MDKDPWGNADDKIRDVTYPISFKSLSPGEAWVESTRSSGTSVLRMKHRITSCSDNFTGLGCNYCADHYFTENCDVVCSPVPESYSCDSQTGEKVCVLGKAGEDCNRCADGWAGTDCKQCATHYYPVGRCSVFCKPTDNIYECTAEGEKSCLGNYAGLDCRECKDHYYGTTCAKFCDETEQYTCSVTGGFICTPTFYGPDCAVFCQETYMYTCNKG